MAAASDKRARQLHRAPQVPVPTLNQLHSVIHHVYLYSCSDSTTAINLEFNCTQSKGVARWETERRGWSGGMRGEDKVRVQHNKSGFRSETERRLPDLQLRSNERVLLHSNRQAMILQRAVGDGDSHRSALRRLRRKGKPCSSIFPPTLFH